MAIPAGKQLCSGGPWCPGGQEHCQQVQGHDCLLQISTGEAHLVMCPVLCSPGQDT